MVALRWTVVGGGDKGGIIAREGQDLKSKELPDRLARGSIVEQQELIGQRLHFRRLEGEGPSEGWVSTKLKAVDLLVPVASEADGPKAGEGYPVEGSAAPVLASAPEGSVATPSGAQASTIDEVLRQQIMAAAAECQSGGELAKWCMKYPGLGFPLATGNCKMRVVCFHNAGSAESTYTGPAMNPFLAWVKASGQVELVAMSYPGRDKLIKAAFHESTETLVKAMLPVLYPILTDGVPFVFWGHSVGTWVAFELLQLMRRVGVPMPVAAVFNAFPAPDLPEGDRTWRVSRGLADEEFKKEVTNWDKRHFEGAAKMVFDEPDWTRTFRPQLQADFRLFDEYRLTHADLPRFDFPIHSFFMEQEHYLKPDMVKLWRNWTTSGFEFDTLEGMGHLTCFYDNKCKKVYFDKVTQILKLYLQ